MALEACLLDRSGPGGLDVTKDVVGPSPSVSGDLQGNVVVLHELERSADTLQRIQRALGTYLEDRRSAFSRFYFVGDDDLLEILGNPKDPRKVVPHLPKMFAAISCVEMETLEGSEDGEPEILLASMSSNKNEIVQLTDSEAMARPISVVHGNVLMWLTELEDSMAVTLAALLRRCLHAMHDLPPIFTGSAGHTDADSPGSGPSAGSYGLALDEWVTPLPAQVACLAEQIGWTLAVEKTIHPGNVENCTRANVSGRTPTLKVVEAAIITKLKVMAQNVLSSSVTVGDFACSQSGLNPAVALPNVAFESMPTPLRLKYEQLITELVHQRDVTRLLHSRGVAHSEEFDWLVHLRIYALPSQVSLDVDRLSHRKLVGGHYECRMADTAFHYGFEYLGTIDRLVQTPLTDRCYLTLTQALHLRLGGSPFGPAGTGKTETVKSLGAVLGRFVLVFNCDESFDFAAMGRIFRGLCQVMPATVLCCAFLASLSCPTADPRIQSSFRILIICLIWLCCCNCVVPLAGGRVGML